jgi:aminopeptidase N
MSGDPLRGAGSGATRTWTASLAAARDVSVAVGPFQVVDTEVNGVRLRVGAYSAAARDHLLPLFRRAMAALAARFGPFPFPSLAVARLPVEGGGIEYPGAILMLDGSRLVATHETAHQYFYAMVGNSQAQHPWLDEAFATFAEQLIDATPEPPDTLQVPDRVDSPIAAFDDDERYDLVVYEKGAAALEAARRAAGPARFDAALRCYVAANAWRIAVPADLAHALTALPAALAVLRRAGAIT